MSGTSGLNLLERQENAYLSIRAEGMTYDDKQQLIKGNKTQQQAPFNEKGFFQKE